MLRKSWKKKLSRLAAALVFAGGTFVSTPSAQAMSDTGWGMVASAISGLIAYKSSLSMMLDVKKLHIEQYIDAIPSFICIILMPMTYSISDGILLGLISYVLIRVFAGRWRELNIGMCILAILFILKYTFLNV